jgi:hypothetical protein
MALHKEGGGGDNVAVGWRLPDGTEQRPIVGGVLSLPAEDMSLWVHSEHTYLSTSVAGANVVGSVTDFPVLVRLHGSEFSFDEWGDPATGSDLRFSDGGGNGLDYEIEEWVNNTGTADDHATVWVKVPLIHGSDNDQFIVMHWGRANITGRSAPREVFAHDLGNAGVWHLSEQGVGGQASLMNASSADNALVPENFTDGDGGSTGSASLIGRGVDLDDVDDWLHVPNTGSGDALEPRGDMAMSCWARPSMVSGGNAIFMDRRNESDGKGWASYFLYLDWGGGRPRFIWVNEQGVESYVVSTQPIVAGQWQYLTAVKEGSVLRIFVNGIDCTDPPEAASTAGPSGTLIDATWDVRIGAENGSGHRKFAGLLDELRISSVARSSHWAKLCYENQKEDQSLVWFGEPPTAVLDAPSAVAASYVDQNFIVTWVDNSSNEAGFEIWGGPDLANLVLLGDVGAGVCTYTHAESNCGVSYYFGVKAVSGQFQSPLVATASRSHSMPCTPSMLNASVVGESQVQVSWSGTSPEYVLQARTASLGWNTIYQGATPSYLHAGLQCHTQYTYQVFGANPTGESPPSGEASATTQYCPIQTPTGLVADSGVPGQIRLSWVDNATNENAYLVWRKTEGGSYAQVGTSLPANSTTFLDETVECETRYGYYVKAVDLYTESAASAEVSATTLYCGAGKATAEMVRIAAMYVVGGEPFEGSAVLAVARLYESMDAVEPVYEETYKNVVVHNGLVSIVLGLTEDVASVIRSRGALFYDILIGGVSVLDGTRQPLTASPYSLTNAFNLHGQGSPIGVVPAPVGASYVDTQNRSLYMKAGVADADWVLISP